MSAPSTDDIRREAMHLAFFDYSAMNCPLVMPWAMLANFLMYRSGISVEAIAEMGGGDRRQLAKELMLVANCHKIPSFAQAVTALLQKMPRVPSKGEAKIYAFPGAPLLSSAMLVPA